MKRPILFATCAFLATFVALPGFAQTQQEADAMFAAQDWRGAESAYENLLDDDADNASNWFNLGQARHQLGDLAGARNAYRRALTHNSSTPGRVRFHLARALMTMGRRADAMRELQQLVGTAVSHRQLRGAAEFAPLVETPEFQAVVAAQTPCNTAEYRQFDFWLGEWDIVPTTPGAPAGGQNSITRQQEGCVVQENYTAGAFTGVSINFYDSARRVWHQTWMSNQGGMLYLEGGVNEAGAMVMTDRGLAGAAPGVLNRTTWTPLPGGEVRQHWDRSTDDGATWTTVFDGRYMRRANAN